MVKLDKKMFKEIPKVMKIDEYNSLYIPKALFEHEKYKKLNINSIALYGFLLDRLLSEDVLRDDEGYLYVVVKLDDIVKFFNNKISKSTLINCRTSLIENNLLKVKNKFKNRPSQYYLLKPCEI